VIVVVELAATARSCGRAATAVAFATPEVFKAKFVPIDDEELLGSFRKRGMASTRTACNIVSPTNAFIFAVGDNKEWLSSHGRVHVCMYSQQGPHVFGMELAMAKNVARRKGAGYGD